MFEVVLVLKSGASGAAMPIGTTTDKRAINEAKNAIAFKALLEAITYKEIDEVLFNAGMAEVRRLERIFNLSEIRDRKEVEGDETSDGAGSGGNAKII